MAVNAQPITLFRLGVLSVGLLPGVWLIWQWCFGDLGANPAEAVIHFTGKVGLSLLLATIAFSPAFRLTRWLGILKARRQIGLWSFFWLTLHMLSWMGLDQYWEWQWIWHEMIALEYIRYGAVALLLLIPLALTSFQWVPAKIGWQTWHWLHRLIYISAGLGVYHLWALTRADYLLPTLFAVLLVGLVFFRLVDAWVHRQ